MATFYRPDPDNPGESIECGSVDVFCALSPCPTFGLLVEVAEYGPVVCGTCGNYIREYGAEGPEADADPNPPEDDSPMGE